MRVFNQGDSVRVTADGSDLSEFASKWPSSGMDYSERLSAIFDKRNGDLVDLFCSREFDEGAVSALLDDLKAYAKKKGLLD